MGTVVNSQPGREASASRLRLPALRTRSPLASILPALLTFNAPATFKERFAELVNSPVIVTDPGKLSVVFVPEDVGTRSKKPLSVKLPLLGKERLEELRMARRRSVRVRSISRPLPTGVERLVRSVDIQASSNKPMSPAVAVEVKLWVWMLPLIAIERAERLTEEEPNSTCGEKLAKLPLVMETASERGIANPLLASALLPANLKLFALVRMT